MRVGYLVECTETQRKGVVLDILQASHCTMVLVKWPGMVRWVDAVDLKILDRPEGT